MDVKVKVKCGRCSKSEEKSVSLEAAQKMDGAQIEADRKFEDFAAGVKEVVGSVGYEEDGPEVIVMVRTATGYDIKQLSNMCSTPEAKRNKGCQSRVDYLVKEIFLQNPKKPSTPKSKDNSGGAAPPNNGKGKNGKKK